MQSFVHGCHLANCVEINNLFRNSDLPHVAALRMLSFEHGLSL